MGMYNREDNLRALGADPWPDPDPKPKPQPFAFRGRPWVLGVIAMVLTVIGAAVALSFVL